jgi:transcriptional regulator with XRE-family HTH domain
VSSNVNHRDRKRSGTVSRRVMRGFDSARLKKAREDKKLTRGDLGRLAGVTEAAIGRWENDKRTPQVDVLARVLEHLDCGIEDVVDIEPKDRYPGDWRIIRGLTQPLLGRAVGLSTAAIGRIERGEGGLSEAVARRIAEELRITPLELRESFERARTRPPGTAA